MESTFKQRKPEHDRSIRLKATTPQKDTGEIYFPLFCVGG